MTGFSTNDWLDDFTRRVRDLMKEVVAEMDRPVEWKILRITQTNPHARFVAIVDGEERKFQIDQEEQVLGTTNEQIKEKLRDHLGVVIAC